MGWRMCLLVIVSWMAASCNLAAVPVEVHPGATPENTRPIQTQAGRNETVGKIAYIGSDGNIYLWLGSGSAPITLTTDARTTAGTEAGLVSYQEPTWAPTGDQLAWVRSSLLPNQQWEYRLEVYDLSAGASTSFFTSAEQIPFYIYWSPDASVLSFLSAFDEDQMQLWTSVAGGQAQLIDHGQPYYWTWMEDSESFLAHIGGSVDRNPKGARLQFVSLGASVPEALVFSPLNFQAPVLSPTGDQILVVGRSRIGTDGLFLLSLQGEVLARLGAVEGRVAFDYSPSGRYLAVVTGPEVEGVHIGNLIVVDLVDPGDPHTLPSIAEDVAAFWWSPTQDRLVYLVPGFVPDNYTQPVSFGAQGDFSLRIQAQIYDVTQDRSYALTSFVPTKEFFRILPYYDQYQRSSTIWSPDGSHIVYSASLNGREPGIFIIDADGGRPPIPVGEGVLAFWSFE